MAVARLDVGFGAGTGGDEEKCEEELHFHRVTGTNINLSNSGFTAEKQSYGGSSQKNIVFTSRRLKVGDVVRAKVDALGEKGQFLNEFSLGLANCQTPDEFFTGNEGEMLFPVFRHRYNKMANYIPCTVAKKGPLPVKEGMVISMTWKENGDFHYGYNGIDLRKAFHLKGRQMFGYFILSDYIKKITLV